MEGPRGVQRDRGRRPRKDGERHAPLQVAAPIRVRRRRIARRARHPHQHGVLAGTHGRDATVGRDSEDIEAPGAFLQVPVLPVEGQIENLGLDLVPVAVEHGGADAGGLAGRQRQFLGRDGERVGRRRFRFGHGLRERARGNEQDDSQRRRTSQRSGKRHLCAPRSLRGWEPDPLLPHRISCPALRQLVLTARELGSPACSRRSLRTRSLGSQSLTCPAAPSRRRRAS